MAQLKILMVEDHNLFAKNVISAFQAEHDVTVAASISAAKKELRDETFHVLLVDYDLDDGKGDEVVRWARAEGVAGRIIATSSHDYGNEMLEAAGAEARCSKMEFSKISEVLGADRAAPEPAMPPQLEYVSHAEGHGHVNEDRAGVFDFGNRLIAHARITGGYCASSKRGTPGRRGPRGCSRAWRDVDD